VAYPTGSGSEILRRGGIHNQANDITAFRWNGTHPTTGDETYAVPANHIITLLNFSVCEMADQNGKTFQLWIMVAGSTGINIVQDVAVNAKQTYVWDDRIVLHPGDILKIEATASSNFDIVYSYIDQDWT